MSLGLAVLMHTACGPQIVTVTGFEEVAFVAVLDLNADGTLRRSSEAATFATGATLEVYDDADSLVIVGWSGADLGGLTPSADPLVARIGCAPRLPVPRVATLLLDGEPGATIDPATLPVVSAAWAEDLCPEVAFERTEIALGCHPTDCDPGLERGGRCRFTLTSPYLPNAIEGRVEPDGSLCGRDEAQCAAAPPGPFATARLECRGCRVDAYVAPPVVPLAVELRPIEGVARYDRLAVQARDGSLPSRMTLGFAYDVAIMGEHAIVAASVHPLEELWICGDTSLIRYRLSDLTRIDAREADFCTTLLGTYGQTLVSVTQRPEHFVLTVFDAELDRVRSVDLAVEHLREPIGFDCDLAHDLAIVGSRAFVLIEVGTNPRCGRAKRMLVVSVDLDTMQIAGPVQLASAYAHRLGSTRDRLWALSPRDRRLLTLDPLTLASTEERAVDVDVGFTNTELYDAAYDAGRDAMIAATTRKLRGLRRGVGFAESTFLRSPAANPTGIWLEGDRGLVFATRDAHGGWSTRVAEVDLSSFTPRPGFVEVGYGPPRRVLSDPGGGVLALLGWDPALVRVRFTARPE